MYKLVDMRDFMSKEGGNYKIFPYAKNLFYHPSGVLSMTIEVYNDEETQEFSFGFNPNGQLKALLERTVEAE
jgi:hypothetical protein